MSAGRIEDARRLAEHLQVIRPELTATKTVTVSACEHARHPKLFCEALIGTRLPP